MKKEAFQTAFGDVPETFEYAITKQLYYIEEKTSAKKIKWGNAVVIVCVMTLVAAIACATVAQWDMQSFIMHFFGEKMTQEAQNEIKRMNPGEYLAENEDVVFTVREALYDGEMLHILFAAAPKKPNQIYLLAEGNSVDMPLGNLSIPGYENDLTSICESDWARGKTMLGFFMDAAINGETGNGSSGQEATEADGTVAFRVETRIAAAPNTDEVEVLCTMYTWIKRTEEAAREFDTLQFTFPLKVSRLTQNAIIAPRYE